MIKQGIKIAISGKSGCGNTTLSKLLAQTFKLRMVNYTFRNMAAEMNMELRDLLYMAEQDESWDRSLDAKQVELTNGGDCVLGSRLAIWVLKDADLKVYLTASGGVRAARIHQRQGGDFEDVLNDTVQRDKRDRERYLKLYGIDNDNFEFADLVLDSSCNSPEVLMGSIVRSLQDRNLLDKAWVFSPS